MDLHADDLMLFSRVIDAGSLSAAAKRLEWPKSTVSRRLAALERHFGERLVQRSTRKLTLTEFGQGVLEHARQVAAEVDDAQALAAHRQQRPSGRLRVSMPGDVATQVLGDILSEFMAAHPAIALEMDLSPRRVDLIAENFDLAVRMGELQDEALLSARRLAAFTAGLYVAPSYLARHGPIVHPTDLARADGLLLLGRGGDARPWQLHESAGDGHWTGLPVTRATANSPELLIQLARAGRGVTAVSDLYAAPAVRTGALVRVLPDWCLPSVTAWAVFPERRLMPARTRVFIDALLVGLAKRCAGHRGETDPPAVVPADASGAGSPGEPAAP
ncbi:LysR family transcriptional regulator [Leptothrix cholodnii]|nr:LysR family transcriptional regulator [Leptothrix cholodnii]